MSARGNWVGIGVCVALASSALPAAAQGMYRCTVGSSTYLSDRPCTAASSNTKLGYIAPQPERPIAPVMSYTPSMAKAPDHLVYLSPACSSLNEAIRTGPARGLRGSAINDLHNEYRTKCAEEEAEAHQKLSRERQDQHLARRQEQSAQQAEQQRSTREREQCHELLRILHGKRQRLAEMNAGEKADFERSEANYHARCAVR